MVTNATNTSFVDTLSEVVSSIKSHAPSVWTVVTVQVSLCALGGLSLLVSACWDKYKRGKEQQAQQARAAELAPLQTPQAILDRLGIESISLCSHPKQNDPRYKKALEYVDSENETVRAIGIDILELLATQHKIQKEVYRDLLDIARQEIARAETWRSRESSLRLLAALVREGCTEAYQVAFDAVQAARKTAGLLSEEPQEEYSEDDISTILRGYHHGMTQSEGRDGENRIYGPFEHMCDASIDVLTELVHQEYTRAYPVALRAYKYPSRVSHLALLEALVAVEYQRAYKPAVSAMISALNASNRSTTYLIHLKAIYLCCAFVKIKHEPVYEVALHAAENGLLNSGNESIALQSIYLFSRFARRWKAEGSIPSNEGAIYNQIRAIVVIGKGSVYASVREEATALGKLLNECPMPQPGPAASSVASSSSSVQASSSTHSSVQWPLAPAAGSGSIREAPDLEAGLGPEASLADSLKHLLGENAPQTSAPAAGQTTKKAAKTESRQLDLEVREIELLLKHLGKGADAERMRLVLEHTLKHSQSEEGEGLGMPQSPPPLLTASQATYLRVHLNSLTQS